MLSLGASLPRVLRLCIAPSLSGGRSSYFAGTHSIMNGFDLSTASFRIGAVMFSAETHETRRSSAGNKTKMCMAFKFLFKTVHLGSSNSAKYTEVPNDRKKDSNHGQIATTGIQNSLRSCTKDSHQVFSVFLCSRCNAHQSPLRRKPNMTADANSSPSPI